MWDHHRLDDPDIRNATCDCFFGQPSNMFHDKTPVRHADWVAQRECHEELGEYPRLLSVNNPPLLVLLLFSLAFILVARHCVFCIICLLVQKQRIVSPMIPFLEAAGCTSKQDCELGAPILFCMDLCIASDRLRIVVLWDRTCPSRWAQWDRSLLPTNNNPDECRARTTPRRLAGPTIPGTTGWHDDTSPPSVVGHRVLWPWTTSRLA